MIAYYLIGLLTGVSLTAFFIGKGLYKYYNKSIILQKQLNRVLKLNDNIKNFNNLNSINAENSNIESMAS